MTLDDTYPYQSRLPIKRRKSPLKVFVNILFAFGIAVGLSFAGRFIYEQFKYPPLWTEIKTGMTRAQIHQLIGEPSANAFVANKLDVWISAAPIGEWVLRVKYNNSSAELTDITLFYGGDYLNEPLDELPKKIREQQ